ncbi:hypothetical protein DY000_02014472 [Brassica cretica]|uniref:Retrotransposon gag domain-containing protein n=1 Tax=Brassica cretica TaxID=69181 RepID=A0ABQ7CNG9_BRACR|nr:hypothetical protein DY000_02014472 [Brassica cretica]
MQGESEENGPEVIRRAGLAPSWSPLGDLGMHEPVAGGDQYLRRASRRGQPGKAQAVARGDPSSCRAGRRGRPVLASRWSTGATRLFQTKILDVGFGSTLTGPALQWYINLPSRSIASFAVLRDKFVEQFASSRDLEKTSDSLYVILQHRAEPLRGYIARFNQEKVAIPECSIPTAISAFKRGLLPDGDLYKELTKYQCKTMQDVLSRAWAQVKWDEDVASRAKAQQKQDPKTTRPDQTERDEKPSQRPVRDSGNRNRGMYQNRQIEKAEGMAVSTWPDISHLSASRPELINVLRQMGQQIEVNELHRKGHLREFLSEKAKGHLSKETTGKPTEAAPVLPPRQDRVIHVISGSSKISGISHAAAKKSTWNAKHSLEAAKPKRQLLRTDEISFMAKEQEKVLTPHHDALVISLTLANCLVKRILVDNGSSGNIIFQAAYMDLGLEKGALTWRVTPLIDHSEGKDQGLIAITEQVSGSSHRGTGGRRYR